MPLFEVTLLLLAIAVVMMQLARYLRVPYPALLALVGGCATLLPFAPHLTIEPRLALALFVAPAVVDTAFDLPPRELMRNWVPLVSLAVLLVLVTTGVVAWVGVTYGGLSIAAAIALGAIVAPPDAAAAAAVLSEFDLPRRPMAVLQGESLLNDAVALLAFGIAVSAAMIPGASLAPLVPPLLIAIPGGILVGLLAGALGTRIMKGLAGSLSAIIVQFLLTFGTWILAAHLNFSPILAVVALAAVAAHEMPKRTSARHRIHANVVWSMLTFVLNVLAFLLMGLQARDIISGMRSEALASALEFSGLVLLAVIVVRFVWVMAYGFVIRRFKRYFVKRTIHGTLPAVRIGVLVSWCGMRGLVTLATALALPTDFPHRDRVVLCAFAVVLGTLVIQGFTIRPLIAWLKIPKDDSLDVEIAATRKAMLTAALDSLSAGPRALAEPLRAELTAAREASVDRLRPDLPQDPLRRTALAAERALLTDWRQSGRIADDVFHYLEDELDRLEMEISAGSAWLET